MMRGCHSMGRTACTQVGLVRCIAMQFRHGLSQQQVSDMFVAWKANIAAADAAVVKAGGWTRSAGFKSGGGWPTEAN